jgi:3-oxoacyl-(acyl-carrier-protein) synthase
MKRVVVTGVGAVSPFGPGVKAYWDGVRSGVCAIRPVTLIDVDGLRCRIAAEVPEPVQASARRSRADRLGLQAAREAAEDAGLGGDERRQAGLVVGAVGGGMLEVEPWYWGLGKADGRGLPRAALRAILPSSHADVIGHALGLGGPRETLVTACSSGAASIAVAAELILDGVTPVALAGGADALTRICYLGFNALKLLDPEPCRPFDRERRGMSIGEGAAFLVLEDAEHARARGARAYAELAGCGMTSDAFHVTSPDPCGDGMVRAMRAALRQVFGDGGLLVSSTKSMIGHTMAAAGSLEALATILALGHDTVPPTASLRTPDADVPFDCVAGQAREAPLEYAISNSFGFGGQNVTLLFRRA